MSKKNTPYLPDLNTLQAMGYDANGVRTGASALDGWLKQEIKKNLRIMNEQQFIHRYKWHNLPEGLTQELIERILFYRGTAVGFYSPELKRFFILPYSHKNEIDCYGRFKTLTPLLFTGSNKAQDKDGKLKEFIPGLGLRAQYEVQVDGFENLEDIYSRGIPLFDYSKQESQIILPRSELSDALIDMEADLIPYMKTALMNSTGVVGMRTGSTDEAADVALASMAVDRAAKNQLKYVPMVGATAEFQDLTSDNVARAEEFLIAMQSIDNFRQMLMGLGQGNLFQTKAHELQSQYDMSVASVSPVYQDGLYQRQDFCNRWNSVFGTGIWCDEGQAATGYDSNLDGITSDNMDQSGAGNDIPEETNLGGEDNA